LLWDEAPPQGPSIARSRLDYDAKSGFNLVMPWERPPENVVWLPSENSPDDLNNYVKIGKARLRRYEGPLYMNALPYDDEPRADAEARMTRRMRRLMTDSHEPVLKYLEWRLQAWQRAHPDEPAPRQVLLFEIFYRIHNPDEQRGWDGPFLIPQARWQPDAPRQQGKYLVEPFDYSDQRFQPMAR
jgi:hypothetical protein